MSTTFAEPDDEALYENYRKQYVKNITDIKKVINVFGAVSAMMKQLLN